MLKQYYVHLNYFSFINKTFLIVKRIDPKFNHKG